ncbi:DoxX family membrane protein [bacterium]|nr:DoxX family membrane protein [bacterium]
MVNGTIWNQYRARLILFAQVVLSGIFIYAGIAKLWDPLRFASSILGYQIIPVSLVRPIVWVLPWIEIFAGLALITGWKVKQAAGTIAAMLVVFTLLLIYAISQGWIIDCGCFGKPHPADWQKVLENLAMLMVAVGFTKYPESARSPKEWRNLFR